MKIITTSDGSSSVYSEQFDATYHSIHGAILESQHVFIKSGLHKYLEINPSKKIRIFEMGFGAGLNAFLAFLETKDVGIAVEYTAIELYPLAEEIYAGLNYPELLHHEMNKVDFLKMHECEWNNFCSVSDNFRLKKMNVQLEKMVPETSYHLIFFDAFAYTAQPELWTTDIFSKLFNSMESGGVFVTYSAKGQVRRNLQAAGFSVERIPGPPRKREMLRAIKPLSSRS